MKIYDFASLNIDRVYTVTEFVRTGETISSVDLQFFPGGKGLNQAIAAKRAGAEVYVIGVIGHDGEMLKNSLLHDHISLDYLKQSNGVSGHAIIQVNNSGDNCIIVHPGANHEMDQPFVDAVLSRTEKGDIVLLTNEINEVPYIIQKAHHAGLKVVFNAAPFAEQILTYPFDDIDILIINEVEGKSLTGKDDVEEILEDLIRKYPNMDVLLTMGARGSIYRSLHEMVRQEAYKTTVVDTTAAGDTFTGYFLASITAGRPVGEAMRIAGMAASIAVSRMGASNSIPFLADVQHALTEHRE